MQNTENNNTILNSRVNHIEKAGLTTDWFSIILICLIALISFVGYYAGLIGSDYLRLAIYLILVLIFFWLIISISLLIFKRIIISKNH